MLQTTDFFGDTFSRFRDRWGNLWWVYRHSGEAWAGDADDAGDPSATGDDQWEQTSPELTYIHDTLMSAMQDLRDPRAARP